MPNAKMSALSAIPDVNPRSHYMSNVFSHHRVVANTYALLNGGQIDAVTRSQLDVGEENVWRALGQIIRKRNDDVIC